MLELMGPPVAVALLLSFLLPLHWLGVLTASAILATIIICRRNRYWEIFALIGAATTAALWVAPFFHWLGAHLHWT